MKSISLYVDKDTYLTRMHPFTKLCYILTAVAASLIAGKLWAFAIFIGISLVMLISGKIMKKVFPLIAFSFTILITIFLIHGLFNHENANLMFQLGPLKFYREGMMYALRISCNVLNMLLAFAVFVLTTKPAELVEDLELISPVVMSSLINTRERAIALEIRGFEAGQKKTYLREGKMKTSDRVLCLVMAVVIAGAIVVRIVF